MNNGKENEDYDRFFFRFSDDGRGDNRTDMKYHSISHITSMIDYEYNYQMFMGELSHLDGLLWRRGVTFMECKKVRSQEVIFATIAGRGRRKMATLLLGGGLLVVYLLQQCGIFQKALFTALGNATVEAKPFYFYL